MYTTFFYVTVVFGGRWANRPTANWTLRLHRFLRRLVNNKRHFAISFMDTLRLGRVSRFFHRISIEHFGVPLVRRSHTIRTQHTFIQYAKKLHFNMRIFTGTLRPNIVRGNNRVRLPGLGQDYLTLLNCTSRTVAASNSAWHVHQGNSH